MVGTYLFALTVSFVNVADDIIHYLDLRTVQVLKIHLLNVSFLEGFNAALRVSTAESFKDLT